ncbi:MAG: EF-hand domain-containing protein [Alphaproteobacteria bacterium]
MANTKKSPAKKTPVRKTTKATVKKVVKPVEETYSCGCNHGCACGGHCAEHTHCVCHKGRFWKKLVLFLVVFALGFATAKLCCCHKRGGFMPRPEFDNGCLVVKCPKMAEKVAMMDKNGDGCVDKAEFKMSKKHRRGFDKRDAKPEMPQPAPMPDATADTVQTAEVAK